MAVIKVWRTEDRSIRVELATIRGRNLYRVLSRSACLAEVASVEQVEAELAKVGVSMADLIED